MIRRRFTRLSLACVGVAVCVLSTVGTASASPTTSRAEQGLPAIETPAAAAPEPVCSSLVHKGVEYGGWRYCNYRVGTHSFRNGTEQVFAVGLDYAVWTRWSTNGRLSQWVSLGGQVHRSDYRSVWMTNGPSVNAIGTDGRRCQRTWGQTAWTPWNCFWD